MRLRRARALSVLVVALLVAPALARADGGTESAAEHFHHGVALYKDGDYSGALVEFRRAQDISPNYRVLYDIGQSLYQLQRYAEALEAFEDYLTQGGTQLPAARRTDVQADLRDLRERVGYVEIAVSVDGAEVRVDDQVVGTSPLVAPVLVSVGHRKITAVKGAGTVEKLVDVAVGDHAKVAMDFAPAETPSPPALQPAPPTPPAAATAPPPAPATPHAATTSSLAWIPWAATGALAAGTAVTGILAVNAKSHLSGDLSTFPGNPTQIDQDRSHAKTFGVLSDVCLGGAAVAAGVALYITFRPHAASPTAGVAPRLRVGLDGVRLEGTF